MFKRVLRAVVPDTQPTDVGPIDLPVSQLEMFPPYMWQTLSEDFASIKRAFEQNDNSGLTEPDIRILQYIRNQDNGLGGQIDWNQLSKQITDWRHVQAAVNDPIDEAYPDSAVWSSGMELWVSSVARTIYSRLSEEVILAKNPLFLAELLSRFDYIVHFSAALDMAFQKSPDEVQITAHLGNLSPVLGEAFQKIRPASASTSVDLSIIKLRNALSDTIKQVGNTPQAVIAEALVFLEANNMERPIEV